MARNGSEEVKIGFGDLDFSGSVAPEKREMDGNGDADVRIECGGLIEKLTSAQPSESVQIPRVPRHKRGADKGYDPTVVSIGPYHHGNKDLEDMEKIKVEYLRKLVSRDDADEEAVVQRYLECVQKREEDARRCYSKEITALCSSQFVEMMVLDGCFILELFLSYSDNNRLSGEMGMELVYSTEWFPKHVRTDLLLLENQIPFFILEELIQLINFPGLTDDDKKKSLLWLAIYYITQGELGLETYADLADKIEERSFDVHPDHLLHLYYLFLGPPFPEPRATMCRFSDFKRRWRLPFIHCLLLPFACLWLCFGRGNGRAAATASPRRRDGSAEEPRGRNIPCAKDLRKVLVRFERKEGTYSFIDVTFQDGTLQIPQMWIEQPTEPLLQNLIALEQSRPELPQVFSGYAWLMDNLINTEEDIDILQKEKILQTNMGSNKAIATYFNKLCQGQNLKFDKHHFKDIFNELNKHAEEPRNGWGALFVEAYFSNPWVLIAFVAAVLLFVMSLLQTIFSSRS